MPEFGGIPLEAVRKSWVYTYLMLFQRVNFLIHESSYRVHEWSCTRKSMLMFDLGELNAALMLAPHLPDPDRMTTTYLNSYV